MESIKVAIRIRLEDELESGKHFETTSCINYDTTNISITKPKDSRNEISEFRFDTVFSSETTQEDVFNHTKYLIDASLSGYNATIFAFGISGSGKTHTIMGSSTSPGIVPRAINHVFNSLKKNIGNVSFVYLTFIELYNNTLYDLLSNNNCQDTLKIHEHPTKGITITGSSTIRLQVNSANETLQLISNGNKFRATATTNMNERSSRSHTVITLEIVQQILNENNEESTLIGKLNLVDLAGSERVKISGAEGQAFEEAKQINLALSVLGDVLNSLSKPHTQTINHNATQQTSNDSLTIPTMTSSNIHIPYRNSKLTMLLKDSLGGNGRTMMIATIRHSISFYAQTMITLRYASRTKLIQCNPIQNVLSKDHLNEIKLLQIQLNKYSNSFQLLNNKLIDLENENNQLLSINNNNSNNINIINELNKEINLLKTNKSKEIKELKKEFNDFMILHENENTFHANSMKKMQEKLNQSNISNDLLINENNLIINKQKELINNNKLLINNNNNQLIELNKLKNEYKMIKIDLSNTRTAVATHETNEKHFNEALLKLTNSRIKNKNIIKDLTVRLTNSLEIINELSLKMIDLKSLMEAKDTQASELSARLTEQNTLMNAAAKNIVSLESEIESMQTNSNNNNNSQQTDKQTPKQTDEQSDKRTDKRTDKQTDEQTDKQTDKEIENKYLNEKNIIQTHKHTQTKSKHKCDMDTQTSVAAEANNPTNIQTNIQTNENNNEILNNKNNCKKYEIIINEMKNSYENEKVSYIKENETLLLQNKQINAKYLKIKEKLINKENELLKNFENKLLIEKNLLKMDINNYYTELIANNNNKSNELIINFENKINELTKINENFELKIIQLNYKLQTKTKLQTKNEKESENENENEMKIKAKNELKLLTNKQTSTQTNQTKMNTIETNTDSRTLQHTDTQTDAALPIKPKTFCDIFIQTESPVFAIKEMNNSFDFIETNKITEKSMKTQTTNETQTTETDETNETNETNEINEINVNNKMQNNELNSMNETENANENTNETNNSICLSEITELTNTQPDNSHNNHNNNDNINETNQSNIHSNINEIISLNNHTNTQTNTSDALTLLTPKKENLFLRNCLLKHENNEKEMLIILESKLIDLNDARNKLLQLNSIIRTRKRRCCLSICPSDCLSVCLFDCLSVLLSVCPIVCLSDCLSVCLSDYLIVCMSVLFV